MTTGESKSDLEAVYAAIVAGKKPAEEPKRRVHERAERIRQELREKYGVLNVAVALVREGRDE